MSDYFRSESKIPIERQPKTLVHGDSHHALKELFSQHIIYQLKAATFDELYQIWYKSGLDGVPLQVAFMREFENFEQKCKEIREG